MKVTREMIGAAHDICLKKGDFVLSADLLERIYLAMDALANHAETSGSPPKEQAVEPVAWMYKESDQHSGTTLVTIEPMSIYGKGIPLYTTPPNHRAVMERALEALELLWVKGEAPNHQEAIAALRKALGEQG